MNIILASASPRRKEILGGLGVSFSVLAADADESCSLTDAEEYARELARRKGQAVLELLRYDCRYGEDTVIISADTVVAAGGEILGKPLDEKDARRMLHMLSGGSHRVVTGIGVTYRGVTYTAASVTSVTVAQIPEREIEKYIAGKDPFDKAGSYGIQGEFSKWVEKIDGCYFNVVGLPANALNKLYFEVTGEYL